MQLKISDFAYYIALHTKYRIEDDMNLMTKGGNKNTCKPN
jgi:hypothetical protein